MHGPPVTGRTGLPSLCVGPLSLITFYYLCNKGNNVTNVPERIAASLLMILLQSKMASAIIPILRPAFILPKIAQRTTQIRPASITMAVASLQSRREFAATSPRPRDHHFDTLKFVQRLKDDGFTEEQAVAMMKVLSDVIEESIQNLTRTMVLREDQERVTYTQKVDFAKLRSELLTADSTETSLTRASHERLTNELAKLNSRLRDEVQRTQASVRLDLNLEKGRIREEANAQDLKLKETEARIEQESGMLRERLEAVKFSTLQWLMYVTRFFDFGSLSC